MHIHMNTTLGELFNNPDTKEAAKELTSRYLAAMNGGSDTASQSAAEAITEEMVAAMTDSMPLRSLLNCLKCIIYKDCYKTKKLLYIS